MAAFVEQAEVAVAVAVAATPGVAVVGNAFVRQYYLILHRSPELVHRFYQDVSKIGRMEENGTMGITTSMQAINEKILSLHYGELNEQILTVDAQDSFNGGVLVLVTGYLTGKDSLRCKFTQCFFLAPQDKGYFVLNDVFRYVDDGSQSFVNDVEVPLTPDPEPTPVEESHVFETAAGLSKVVDGEVYNPPENGQASIEEEEVPVSKVVDEVLDEWQMVAESNSKTEEVPKKSYAYISRNPKSQTHAVLISIDAKEDPRLGFTVVVSYLHQKAKPTPSSSPLTPKTVHQKAKPKPSSSPPKSQTHVVFISIDAKEDPRLGFTVVVSHLHRQHSKIEPEIELLSPPTHHSKIQMADTMHDDLDDGLRFRNCNCFCGLKANVKISDKQNENRYRLFQCCPKDTCRFFQWCIPLKTPVSYAKDFQQLQEELCVLREELRVIHDKVHPSGQPKKMVKIRFIAWYLFFTALAVLLTMTML